MGNFPHWIVVAARAADLPGANTLEVTGRTPVEEAWAIAQSSLNVDGWQLAEAIAAFFRLEVADLAGADPVAAKLLPGSVARKFNVFPLLEGDRRLVIATASPVDVQAEQQVGFASGRAVVFRIAPPDAIAEFVEAHYAPDRAVANLLERIEPETDASVTILEEEEEPGLEPLLTMGESADEGPIIRLANMILEDAVKKGASDIHLQPISKGGLIRLRIDGVLHSGIRVPLAVLAQVISRIKIMSRLDISDRIRPQDGRARMGIGDRRYDLRISIVPARGGEKAVIRILDPNQSRLLEDSGIPEREVLRVRQALRNRDGILVITGPTGSGKTTTMYAVLQEIASEDVNIMTVEDPVEYELPGLTQIQVDLKKGVTFQSALRAILRQDPDVIFVGEIRDQATAEMAAQASLTGHLVLTTVHANDAVGSVRRFMDLGLDPGTISETLRAALAQRLLRTLCPDCACPATGELDAEEEMNSARFGVRPVRMAVGCEQCGHTGYRGRVPVVEILSPSADLLYLVSGEASHLRLTIQARKDGMRTLLEGGLDLVEAGVTTLAEMVRVLGDEAIAVPVPSRAESDIEPGPQPSLFGEKAPAGATPAPEASSTEVEPPAVSPPQPATPRPGVSDPAPAGPAVASEGDDALKEPPCILLVEDDPDTRLLARTVLESRGWTVDEAINGKEALLKVGGIRDHSLIVLDLGLPDMDGVEILLMLKSNLHTAGIPVVVLTGRTDRDTERQVLLDGADDYIPKPLDPGIFLSRSQAALRRHGA